MYRTSSLSRKRARLRFLARAFIFFVAKSFETTLPFSTTCVLMYSRKNQRSNSASRVVAVRTRPKGEKRR